jgi:hypothetical protein
MGNGKSELVKKNDLILVLLNSKKKNPIVTQIVGCYMTTTGYTVKRSNKFYFIVGTKWNKRTCGVQQRAILLKSMADMPHLCQQKFLSPFCYQSDITLFNICNNLQHQFLIKHLYRADKLLLPCLHKLLQPLQTP